MTMTSLVAHKEEGFPLFHLFGVVSGTLQPFFSLLSYFRVVPSFTRSTFFFPRFTVNQLLQRSVSVIIKWDNFFELQSGASGITK